MTMPLVQASYTLVIGKVDRSSLKSATKSHKQGVAQRNSVHALFIARKKGVPVIITAQVSQKLSTFLPMCILFSQFDHPLEDEMK